MTTQTYEELIVQGLRGLPGEALHEITDFVYFVRHRALECQRPDEAARGALSEVALHQLSRDEEAHLEQEFEGYDQLYPRE